VTKIDRYIAANFLTGCLPVLFLLLTLFSFLGLSEELEDVGDGTYELIDALLVVAYSLPALAVELLPVTALLGGLLGLGALANNQELTSIRAAGISPGRIALPIVSLALALIAVVILLQTLVIPRMEYNATQLRVKTLIEFGSLDMENQPGAGADRDFWTRNEGQFIRVGVVEPDRSLRGVEIYQFDAQGNLTRMIQAHRAQLLQENTWLLYQVYETRLGEISSQTEFFETLLWETLLSEDQAHTLITPAKSLAPKDLWRSIQRLDNNNMNSERQRVIFWRQMSIPLGLLGMALLTIPFLLGSVRSVPVGQRIAMGGLIGISFYLLQQISGHLAGIMQWHSALTVMAPGLLVLCVAILLLNRLK
jgi:lipopolysaccharide export system permease protein